MFKIINLSVFFTIANCFVFTQRIFITGATSKIGRRVVKKLNDRGIYTKCLTRDIKKARSIFGNIQGIELVEGNVLDSEQLQSYMEGCSVSINLHGVNKRSNPFHKLNVFDLHNKIEDQNHPYYVNYISMKNIITSCKKHNIQRIVRITGLATAFSDYSFWPLIINSLYSDQVYWHREAEKDIIQSGLSYTILRPGGIKNKTFDDVELIKDITKPPALIGIENMADIVVRTVLPSKSLIDKPYSFKNKIVACKGINTPLKKGVLNILHP
tara:strand:+ start:2869 stop:3675 length:807 start_codon:yes stop_codon:yes gene_type:complete